MARLLVESFEGAGYENSDPPVADWTETVGDGCTVEPDSTAVARPTNGGDQILEIISAASGYQAQAERDLGSDKAVTYTRVYVQIATGHSINANGEILELFWGFDSTWIQPWLVDLYHDGTDICFRFQYHTIGGWSADYSGYISEDTWYCVEVYYNATAEEWEWKIDGVSEGSGALVDAHALGLKLLYVGKINSGNQQTGTTYFDLVAIDDADWVGVETGAGRTTHNTDAFPLGVNVGMSFRM